MSASKAIDVSLHAQTRWLQRVDSGDPYPGTSVREAFSEAAVTATGRRIRRYHQELGVRFVAVEKGATTIIVTVYEPTNGRGGDDG